MDYTLDPNVFNLVLNLILERLDFETGSKMFELVFEYKLKKIGIIIFIYFIVLDMMTIDVSKNSLKYLLKLHMTHVKALSLSSVSHSVWELEESERSELASVISSPRSKLRIKEMQEMLFPEMKDHLDSKNWFEVVSE